MRVRMRERERNILYIYLQLSYYKLKFIYHLIHFIIYHFLHNFGDYVEKVAL